MARIVGEEKSGLYNPQLLTCAPMRAIVEQKTPFCNVPSQRVKYRHNVKFSLFLHTKFRLFFVRIFLGFTQMSALKTHKRIHSGDKPYKCQYCGMGFNQSGHQQRHEKRHTQTKVKLYLGITLGPACNKFCNNNPATTSEFLCNNIIDNNVKMLTFGVSAYIEVCFESFYWV